MLNWIKGIWKVCWMQWRWITANRWPLLDRRDMRAVEMWQIRLKNGSAGTSRVPIRFRNLSLFDRTTLRHRLQYEGNQRGTRTDHSLKDKIQKNRALPQRTSVMCAEFPLGVRAWRRHPSDRGCRLDWRPKDKVLHVWWSVDNQSVLHTSTLVCDTGNSIAILSRVRGQDDHEGLHWSVVRATSGGTPDCTTVQNWSLDGQQQRQRHYATAWVRTKSKALGGADDVVSIVEQDRTHLAEHFEYVGERDRFVDETRSKSSARQADRNDGFHISWWRNSKVSQVR